MLSHKLLRKLIEQIYHAYGLNEKYPDKEEFIQKIGNDKELLADINANMREGLPALEMSETTPFGKHLKEEQLHYDGENKIWEEIGSDNRDFSVPMLTLEKVCLLGRERGKYGSVATKAQDEEGVVYVHDVGYETYITDNGVVFVVETWKWHKETKRTPNKKKVPEPELVMISRSLLLKDTSCYAKFDKIEEYFPEEFIDKKGE